MKTLIYSLLGAGSVFFFLFHLLKSFVCLKFCFWVLSLVFEIYWWNCFCLLNLDITSEEYKIIGLNSVYLTENIKKKKIGMQIWTLQITKQTKKNMCVCLVSGTWENMYIRGNSFDSSMKKHLKGFS